MLSVFYVLVRTPDQLSIMLTAICGLWLMVRAMSLCVYCPSALFTSGGNDVGWSTTVVVVLYHGYPRVSRSRNRACVERKSENGRTAGLLGQPEGDREIASRLPRSRGS